MKVSGKFVITWNPNSDVVTAYHFRNKKLPCPLVYVIVTMPVSFAWQESVLLVSPISELEDRENTME